MVSVITYGRNNNYGFNLHKCTAIGFDCLAELRHASKQSRRLLLRLNLRALYVRHRLVVLRVES